MISMITTSDSPTSKDVAQGPWWTPTAEVERMMRECQSSLSDTWTLDIKMLEGLLHDSLLWRQDRLRRPVETTDVLARIHVELANGHTTAAFKVVAAAINGEPLPSCTACDVLTINAVEPTQPLPDRLKAPVKAGELCPAFDATVHEEHKGKCMYCGAPMPQVKASCTACEGKPVFPNIPCSLCGRYPDGSTL